MSEVDLVVPLKPPYAAKSRLRGALGAVPESAVTQAGGDAHSALVLAIARDTLVAARATPGVRRILVVTSDPLALGWLSELGVEVVGEHGAGDLNAAIRHGERLARDGAGRGDTVAALQADLPALRAPQLAAALAEAGGRRAFCADRHGVGTTLLVSAAGAMLNPLFGPGSAHAHAESGATPLRGPSPALRGDVDTPADLTHATELGLGEHTAALLGRTRCLRTETA